MHKVQHGERVTRVAEKFEAKDLGAPFKVFLNNSVQVTVDEASGDMLGYSIPDLNGLLVSIVLSRVLHPRKLSGADIKFVRKALGIKQKDLASKIDLSVEHLSRCETGVFPMSPGSEKLLRIYALKTAFKLDKFKACDEKTRLEDAIDRLFEVLKPKSAFSADEELVFEFARRQPSTKVAGEASNDNGYWVDRELKRA